MGRLVIFVACALGCFCAQSSSAHQESSSALVKYFRKGGIDLTPGSYFVHSITAPGKSPALALVYLEGEWCGSSGCELMVVDTSGPKPRTITELNGWTPITIDGRSNGYEIIGVWHHGGGALKPYCEELRFRADGSEYVNDNKRERIIEQRRCTSAKKVLLKKDWY